jgi:hypothetical protein
LNRARKNPGRGVLIKAGIGGICRLEIEPELPWKLGVLVKTLLFAPHSDDELLGCGLMLLRRSPEGGTVGWLLMTTIA